MPYHWQAHPAAAVAPSPKLMPWLQDPASFMQRLRHHQVADARVRVIRQNWQFPNRSEQVCLALLPRQYGLVREVVIDSPAGKWMFARTVFPRSTLTGREQLLARLKNRALGTMLFNHHYAQRGAFEFTLINPGEDWHKKISGAAQLVLPPLWARRSVFSINNKSLLLCEVFFPDLLEL
jgi:chorismate--pyruvate lyase